MPNNTSISTKGVLSVRRKWDRYNWIYRVLEKGYTYMHDVKILTNNKIRNGWVGWMRDDERRKWLRTMDNGGCVRDKRNAECEESNFHHHKVSVCYQYNGWVFRDVMRSMSLRNAHAI
jgi:hypothetical protein